MKYRVTLTAAKHK